MLFVWWHLHTQRRLSFPVFPWSKDPFTKACQEMTMVLSSSRTTTIRWRMICSVYTTPRSQPILAQRRIRLADLPPFERAVVVVTSGRTTAKKILWGHTLLEDLSVCLVWHQLQQGERFTAEITEHQADCIQRGVQCQPTRTHIAFLLWRKKPLLIPCSWIYYRVVQGKVILHQSSAKQACPVIRLTS